MAVSIPGLSLSLLRQQTSVQAGLPLLISGRFTAFGMGVPTFIRVFLEGPSYDPQLRSFDTFASPFSGDYSVNIIAEKDGQYTVYAQAFPPPLIPTGPPFPEAMMLLPPMAESIRPPLVVGYPFNGGVEALMPDGTRRRLEAPAMQPIEFRPLITVGAPGVTIMGIGAPAPPVAGIPFFPGLPTPPAPPPAVPPVEVIPGVAIDDIRFSPEEIDPGTEATGVMSWRNIGDAPQLFDLVLYLVSPVGARYGPLQVNQDISASPQVPATQNMRLNTEGMPSGLYSVVAEIYDSTTGALLTTLSLPGRLQIREIAAPVVPVPPPPVVPEVPTQDILGMPSLNLPRQINVGDIWSGTVSLPTFGTVPYFVEAHMVMIDPSGYEYTVGQGGRTLPLGDTLQVPINYNTAGLPAGNYSLFLMVYDQFGQLVAQLPMGFLSMLEAVLPPVPEIPTVPTAPTVDMFGTPSVNLPSQVEIGEIWQGNLSIPTYVPPAQLPALMQLPSLPPLWADIELQLQSPTGQMFRVGPHFATFTPGETITLPINFDTSVLPQEGIYNLVMTIQDLQGNTLFSNVIGTLWAMMPAVPPPPPAPPPPVPPPPPPPPVQYTLTTSVDPPGAGAVYGGGTYSAGTVTLTATAAAGYEFLGWGGDASGPSTSVLVYMDRNKSVTAHFKEKVVPGYTLTISTSPMGAGRIIKEPDKATYSYGEMVKLTAQALPQPFGAPKYSFSHWTRDGQPFDAPNPMTMIIIANYNLVAYFVRESI